MSGGATVGPSEEIYVVAKGGSLRFENRVFSQERVCNLRVHWVNNQAIEIGYSARSAKLEGAANVGGLGVQTKWLGRDIASGC